MSSAKEKKATPAKAVEKKAIEIDQGLFKKIFGAIFIVFSIFVISSSFSVGIPGDEAIDHVYGQSCLKYYTSFGQDSSFRHFEVYGGIRKLQKFYGAGFEMPAALISSPFEVQTQYTVRHILVALCGILLLLFVGLTCKELQGWGAASIALLLLAASPTVVGHMLFNSKDIPLAMGFAISYYYMIRYVKNFPNPTRGDIIGVIIGIGAALSVRIGGILLVPYLVIFFGIKFLFEKEFRVDFLAMTVTNKLKLMLPPATVSALGILLGLLFYPNFFESPLGHIPDTFENASRLPVSITSLFEGELIRSTELPTNYLLKSLGISLPLTMLLAIPLILLAFSRLKKQVGITNLLFILFVTIFPVAYVFHGQHPIYNGWRHVMFFYPSFIIVAALALSAFLFPFRKGVLQLSIIVLFGGLALKTLVWQFVNIPYQYMYYNEAIGGFNSAYQDYDSDYQQLAVTQGVEWIFENEPVFKDPNRTKKIRIASNNAQALNMYYDAEALNVEFVMTGIRGWRDSRWDYAVLSTIFLSKSLRDFVFPPQGLIHTESVDDRGIAYVVKHENNLSFEGAAALQQQDYPKAKELLLKAYQYDPKNFSVWLNLAYSYASTNDSENTIRYASSYLQLYPYDWRANQLLGLGYLYKNDYANSEQYLTRAMQIRPQEKGIYKNLAFLYQKSNQLGKLKQIQQKLGQ